MPTITVTPLNTILSWFQTDDFPTELQFANSWSSFWHKSDKLPISSIDGLTQLFQQTASSQAFTTHLSDTSAHAGSLAKLDATNLNASQVNAWRTKLGVDAIPSNFALIDQGTTFGNVFTKSQSDARYKPITYQETLTFIEDPVLAGSELAIYYTNENNVRQRGIVDLTPLKNDVLASANTGYKGFLKKSDAMPTVAGLYRLLEPGTYTNLIPAVDEFGNTTSITFEDGKLNDVYYNGTNWQKSDPELIDLSSNFIPSDTTKAQPAKNISDFVSLKTQSIYKIEDFKQGVYFPSTTGLTVSVGNSLQFGYNNAAPDVAAIKIPIVKNEKAFIFTKQGAFTPCFITDYNNVVIEVFGNTPGDYLDMPLEITAGFDGYLYVNAHEFTVAERSKIKVVKGDAYRILQNLPEQFDLSNTFVPSDTTKAQPAKNISDFVTLKTQSIYKINDFKQGVHYPATTGFTVSIGDSLQFGYDNAAPDVATIKIPIVKNEKASIFTKQGVFTPCFITDYNDKVIQIFGNTASNYLDMPLEITAGFDGYLYVNAHEFTVAERSKIKVVKGDAYRILQNLPNPEDDSFLAVLKVVKKNGTVGVNCDFTDIRDALSAITDNSAKKRYFVYVMDGDYDYSNSGNIGIELKNYVTLRGQSYKTRIIKRDSVFSMLKATIDKEPGDVDYIAIEGFFTIISNNCKCPIHIDSGSVKYGLFQNLNLINEQPLGTGDHPVDGEANCFALGWRGDDHIVLRNIKANGKLWGHNYTDTNSKGTFEIINCTCRTLQIGDCLSQGDDNIILKGCSADEFQLLWFSESQFTSSQPYRNSFNFIFEGNKIDNAVIKDHQKINDVPVNDALEVFYKGKFPFSIAGLHKEVYGANIVKGSDVSKVNNSTVKAWEPGETVYGKAVENTDENGRLLIQLK